MEPTLDLFTGRAVLAIAHPGHELRVHGWMQRAKPLVLVLTDGSGGSGTSRLASTERILRLAGARTGSLFGRFPDRQIYQAVLDGNAQLFLDLAVVVAVELERNRTQIVVGDAAEGAILTHDLWRGVVNRAVWLAERSLGRSLARYEFSPEPGLQAKPREGVTLRLSDRELQEKIAAARTYHELAREIEAAMVSEGEEGLRSECLFPSSDRGLEAEFPEAPHYERHGERQVAAGVYPQVVRYQQHVLPILRTLQRERETTSSSTLRRAA